MIKGITKEEHWITDYSYVPLVLSAPTLFKFEDEKQASRLCYALSATVLGYSLLTDAKWGIVKLIPYKTHAALDLTQGLVALTASLLLQKKSSDRARNTLLVMGLTGIVVGVLSLIGSGRK